MDDSFRNPTGIFLYERDRGDQSSPLHCPDVRILIKYKSDF